MDDTEVGSFESVLSEFSDWASCTGDSGDDGMGQYAYDVVQRYVKRLKDAHQSEMESNRAAYEHDTSCVQNEPSGVRDQRREVANRLRELDLNTLDGSHAWLSEVGKCIHRPTFGWSYGECIALRDRLALLLDPVMTKEDDGLRLNTTKCAEDTTRSKTGRLLGIERSLDSMNFVEIINLMYQRADTCVRGAVGSDEIRAWAHALQRENGRLLYAAKHFGMSQRRKLDVMLGGSLSLERADAVRNLNMLPAESGESEYDQSGWFQWHKRLGIAIGVPKDRVSYGSIRDRLTYLIGGCVTRHASECEGALRGHRAEFAIMDELDDSETDRIAREDGPTIHDDEKHGVRVPADLHEATSGFRSWIDEHSPRDGSFWAIGDKIIPEMVEMLDGIDDAVHEKDKSIESLMRERDDLREKVEDLHGQAPSSWHYAELICKYDSLKRASERDADQMESLSQQLNDATNDCEMYLKLLDDASSEFKQVSNGIIDGTIPVNAEIMNGLGWVELPRDADGMPIHAGDIMHGGQYLEDKPFKAELDLCPEGWHFIAPLPGGRAWVSPENYRHWIKPEPVPDTIDSVMDKLMLGEIRRDQAVRLIKELVIEDAEG